MIPIAPSEGTKRCPRCTHTKPTTEFYKNSWAKSGLTNQCKLCAKALQLKKYGLDEHSFADMLTSQGGVCGMCSTDTPGGKGQWHVDHSHKTGVNRELLCHYCNVGLGSLRDSPTVLAHGLRYLAKHGEALTTDELLDILHS